MKKTFYRGIVKGIRFYKIGLIVYSISLLLAITIGFQVYQVMEASIGNSLELNNLISGFDNTIFSDFMEVHGASITPLIGQLRWLLVVYFVFSVFMNGGILYTVIEDEPKWKSFWKGGAWFFVPFLKIAFFFSAILVLWSCLWWIPFLSMLPVSAEVFSSEKVLINFLPLVIIIYLLGIGFIMTWSIVSKTMVIADEKSIWSAIKGGFLWLWKRLLSSTILFWMFLVVQILAIALYLLLDYWTGMVSMALIFTFFFIQQGLIFFRGLWRIMLYSGISDYYISSFNQEQ